MMHSAEDKVLHAMIGYVFVAFFLGTFHNGGSVALFQEQGF